jgi:hypothetical protein
MATKLCTNSIEYTKEKSPSSATSSFSDSWKNPETKKLAHQQAKKVEFKNLYIFQ